MIPIEALAVVLVTLPLIGGSLLFALGGSGRRPFLLTGLAVTSIAALLAAQLPAEGTGSYAIGGWEVPLGIHWRLTSAAAFMLVVTGLVALAAAVHATAADDGSTRLLAPLWLFLWAGLNALFLAADLFNMYVALEVLTLASVALVGLSTQRGALRAALRYLIAALFGSLVYLLGVALLYGQYGVLDLAALTERVDPDDPGARLAAAAITVGLMLKAAIFPLHFWLPGAHGRARPAVSALLSGLVVAAAWILLMRLWLGPLWPLLTAGTGMLLGTFGAGAMLWGGIQALVQPRLKMLVAYSTISQFGFLMLVFPLATSAHRDALHAAGVLLIANHALAKAALFLAAGTLIRLAGDDRIRYLGASGKDARWAWLAVVLAAAALVGLPPSLGFHGKWTLLQVAIRQDAWGWVAAILIGTLLTFAYLFRLLERAFAAVEAPARRRGPGTAALLPALLLAASAVSFGLAGEPLTTLLRWEDTGR